MEDLKITKEQSNKMFELTKEMHSILGDEKNKSTLHHAWFTYINNLFKEIDKQLIDQTKDLIPSDWVIIDDLMEKALLDETKEDLRIIRNKLFHKEEYQAGLH